MKQKEQNKHRIIDFFFYNDDETSDCWSIVSYLIVDDDDTTFIWRIHGMILWICTEPLRNKENKNEIILSRTYQLNQQRKFLQLYSY